MARMGFGDAWECLLANDIDAKKVMAYRENWCDGHLVEGDIADLSAHEIPGAADVAWASFPCQDLSLAGTKAGLRGGRSGTFWPFWELMRDLRDEGRHPPMIILENVYGALTSHKGKDIAAIADALVSIGYKIGVQVIDAAMFVPQSRVRLFIVAVREDLTIPNEVVANGMKGSPWYPDAALRAYNALGRNTADNWVWWNLPVPGVSRAPLETLIDIEPQGIDWHTKEQTERLLSLMTEVNRSKVELAKQSGKRQIGTIYRRTRQGIQRAEVRFDGVAGCLRTPTGGSSRQTIVEVNGNKVRTRLISAREAARLMGLPESYRLPNRYNDTYHLLGDGLVVPVVSFLVTNLVEPVLFHNSNLLGKVA